MDTNPTPPDALTTAVQGYFASVRSNDPNQIVPALATALGLFAAASGIEAMPGTDFEIRSADRRISIEPMTPAGEGLAQSWGQYVAAIEYEGHKMQIMTLSTVLGQAIEKIKALQTQLDNVMMDVDKIKRKLRA